MSLLSDIRSLQAQKDANIRHWWQQSKNNLSVAAAQNQAVLNEGAETLQEQNEEVEKKGIVTGASDESAELAKAGNRRAYTDSVRQLAGYLDQQRQNIDTQAFEAQQVALQERIADKERQRANISQAASGVVQSGLGLAGAFIGGPAGAAIGSKLGKAATDTVVGQQAINGSDEPVYVAKTISTKNPVTGK